MKKTIFFVIALLGLSINAIGQMGVGTITPEQSSMLDVSSDTKGFLMPRMSSANRIAITMPADGLMVYDTDTHSSWICRLGIWNDTGNCWQLTGNSGTTASNFIGTTDAADLLFRVNNQLTGKLPSGGGYLALGYHAGNVNVASGNIALGYQALLNNTNGQENIAIGARALESQSFINSSAAWSAYNVAIGNGALQSNQPTSSTNGSRNTAVGHQVLNANTNGAYNTGVGYKALGSNTTANNNVAIGYNALFTQSYNNGGFTYPTNNTAIGNEALFSNQPQGSGSANNNTAIGYKTLYANTTGNSNIAVGSLSLSTNTTGSTNISIGSNSMLANIIGSSNIAIGSAALRNNTSTGNNLAIGNNALYLQSYNAGPWPTANVAIGDNALMNNQPVSTSTGYQNTAVGFSSMLNNTSGYSNTAVGGLALNNNMSGYMNSALGLNAFNGSNYHNSTALGFDAQITADNQVKLGDENVTSLVCKAAYVATTTESPNLYVDNTGQISRSTSSSQVKMTSTGGVAISLTNGSGSPLPKGTIVTAGTTDNSFKAASANSEYAIGVLADNCPSGSQGWVIVSGIAEVLMQDGSASLSGNWAGVSDSEGRAYFAASPLVISEHDREIGHCIQTAASGTNVLVKVVLQFR